MEILNAMALQYSMMQSKTNDDDILLIDLLVPDAFVDELINRVSEELDLREKTNSISIMEVEAFVSTHLDRFKEKVSNIPLNPIERLVESTEKYTNLEVNLVSFAVFATLVSVFGLFSNNVSIVIGAMLLSPLLGPINAFAVNTNLGRVKYIIKSQQTSLVLLFVVVVCAFFVTYLFGFFIPLSITNEIAIRNDPSIIDVLLAFILGCAAGLALVTDFSELLVGVAVAVALLPPAAVTGIGCALGEFQLAYEAFLLSLVNLLGLQLGCTLILNLKGVTPRRYYQKNIATSYYRSFIIVIILTLLILSLIIYIQR